MDEYESLSHSKWECKYHLIFIPKCRRKTLYKELRQHLGEVFRRLAEQKQSRIEEGHLMADHVHMMISIPPSTRCQRWWASSRARVRFTLRGFMESASRILLVNISGRGDTWCPR